MAVNEARPLAPARPVRQARAEREVRVGDVLFTAVSQLILIVWTVMVVFPFLWMIVTSFKTDKEIFFSPWTLPATPQWDNFARAWTQASIGRYFLNSLIVVTCSLTLTLIVSAMAAYVLARYQFRGNRVLFYLFLAGMMFPIFLALVPLFEVVSRFPLMGIGNRRSLIVVYVAYSLPFSIFFLYGFFRTLPSEIAEAAVIDGASDFTVFWRIMLPMAQPGLVTVGIFNFLGQWNQYLLPLVLNPKEENYVLPQGLAFLAINQGYKNDWSALFAGLTVTMIPTILVYVIFQRRLEKGLTAGALKG